MILGFMTSSVLWTAYGLRMLPDKREVELESRIRLGQVQTLPTMHYLRDLRYRELKDFLSNMAKQHPEIISVGVRSASGRLIVDVNDHNEHWTCRSTKNQIPITSLLTLFKAIRSLGV